METQDIQSPLPARHTDTLKDTQRKANSDTQIHSKIHNERQTQTHTDTAETHILPETHVQIKALSQMQPRPQTHTRYSARGKLDPQRHNPPHANTGTYKTTHLKTNAHTHRDTHKIHSKRKTQTHTNTHPGKDTHEHTP